MCIRDRSLYYIFYEFLFSIILPEELCICPFLFRTVFGYFATHFIQVVIYFYWIFLDIEVITNPVSYTHLDVYKRQPQICLYLLEVGVLVISVMQKLLLNKSIVFGPELAFKEFKKFFEGYFPRFKFHLWNYHRKDLFFGWIEFPYVLKVLQK